jgi:hypothetical protein
MPGRIPRWQRYRDIAAECRKKASTARSPKTRTGFEVFASRYDELAEAELRRAPPHLFRCPITKSDVQGFFIEVTLGDDPNSYTSVRCLACGQMHRSTSGRRWAKSRHQEPSRAVGKRRCEEVHGGLDRPLRRRGRTPTLMPTGFRAHCAACVQLVP